MSSKNSKNNKEPDISIILPCRNEEMALNFCLQQIKNTIKKHKLSTEVIVSDSSSDSSPEIVLRQAQDKQNNIVLLKHDKEGYGTAYLEAFKIAKGKYIFMADADGTYEFKEIPNFIKELKCGNDLVLGNRFGGIMEEDAMPFKSRYIGNPILSFILRLFFFTKVKDTQTGMRAIKKDSLDKIFLYTTGMEFASEMIIKAIKNNFKIKEIPINYKKRMGESKLRPFSDAWKHMRFMLLFSPLFLFFIPGAILFVLGITSMTWLYFGSPNFFGIKLYYHPMFFSSALIIIGYQLIIFSAFAKSYAINHLGEKSEKMEKLYKFITIERASIAGISLLLAGALIYAIILTGWVGSGFKNLNEIKNSIVALTFIIFGVQTVFSSFMLSILSIKNKIN